MSDMRRREFITLLGGAAAAWPLAAQAQQGERVRRIGVVMAYTESDSNGQVQVGAFRQQLQKLGWMEGNNIQIDFRYAADNPARIRALAVELLETRPDGIQFQPRHNDPSVGGSQHSVGVRVGL